MELPTASRRKFLVAIANLGSTGWIAMNWPQIAYAAQHGGHSDANDAPPTRLNTLSPAEAADIEAIAGQIVPSGKTPGAKEARVIYFIDNALGSFFGAQLPSFRQGMAEFQGRFAKAHGGKPFAAASDAIQIAWLHDVDRTPFFMAAMTIRAQASASERASWWSSAMSRCRQTSGSLVG
jgi:hypothetical protein